MAEITDITANLPHRIQEVICIECKERWISVAPTVTKLRYFTCPNGHVGFVIATGCIGSIEDSGFPDEKPSLNPIQQAEYDRNVELLKSIRIPQAPPELVKDDNKPNN